MYYDKKTTDYFFFQYKQPRLDPKINRNNYFSGSHDSMSYGISKSRSSVAPDALPVVDGLFKVMPCVIRRWAITQKLTTTQQLNCGIRYKFSMEV